MALQRDGAPTDTLRQAARLYVDATSMSPTGLRGFIDGADPYIKTTRKLTEWYIREIQNRNAELSHDSATAALSLLVKHLPAGEREKTAGEVLAVIDRRCRETSTPRPVWLADLREPPRR